VINVLVKIYRTTHKAGLRKPATIQELELLGRVLERDPAQKLSALLKSFIIKYDDDWDRYTAYLSRSPEEQKQEEQEDQEDQEEEKTIRDFFFQPENEQKPIVDGLEEISENFHGGTESTQSLPGSPNPGGDQKNQNGSNDNDKESSNDIEKFAPGSSNPGADQENQNGSNDKESSEQAFKAVKTSLSDVFYRFLEYLGEETKQFSNNSGKYFDYKELALRQYTGKSLSSIRHEKARETLVVILDNSGSMKWLSEEISEIAGAALERQDVRVLYAPNGSIETELHKSQEIPLNHEEIIKELKDQHPNVLYVGDFDGGDTPVLLSQKMRVFWLCTENRYQYFSEHNWMHYGEQEFQGFFGRAWNLQETISAFKEFIDYINYRTFWWDPPRVWNHQDDEDEEYEDDENGEDLAQGDDLSEEEYQ
ncbi:MAG: hypothetical protein ACP5T9_06590, partial [Thermoplasmata archaeon]